MPSNNKTTKGLQFRPLDLWIYVGFIGFSFAYTLSHNTTLSLQQQQRANIVTFAWALISIDIGLEFKFEKKRSRWTLDILTGYQTTSVWCLNVGQSSHDISLLLLSTSYNYGCVYTLLEIQQQDPYAGLILHPCSFEDSGQLHGEV
jgi:hypothetical protein